MSFFFDPAALQEFMSGVGVWAPIVFFLLQLLQVVLAPIPGNILTLAGGALFGFWKGFFISYAAISIGSVLCFLLARHAGNAVIRRLIGDARVEKYTAMLSSDSASARTRMLLILIFLMPFLPDDLLCFVAGLTPVSLRSFVIIILTTRPWGHVVAALIGSDTLRLSLGATIALGAVSLVGAILAVRFAPQFEHAVLGLVHRIIEKVHGKTSKKDEHP